MVPGSGSAPGGGRTTSRNIAAPQPRGADLEASSCQWRQNSRAAYMSGGCGVGCLASDAMGATGARRACADETPVTEVRGTVSLPDFCGTVPGGRRVLDHSLSDRRLHTLGNRPPTGVRCRGGRRSPSQAIAEHRPAHRSHRCAGISLELRGELPAPIAAETDGRRCRLALPGLMQSLDRNRATVKAAVGAATRRFTWCCPKLTGHDCHYAMSYAGYTAYTRKRPNVDDLTEAAA